MKKFKQLSNNIFWGGIAKVINLLGHFFIRTIIIYTLGNEYLGLDSLFTSFLTVLSIAELGLGSAMVYFLYKPMAEADYILVSKYLSFYKKAYQIIGFIILCLGLTFMPFIKLFIKGTYPDSINLYTLYFIYLLNTVSSYFFFAYKQVILKAAQRNDISSKILALIRLLMYLSQSVLLLTVHNYYGYVILLPLSNITINCIEAWFVNKLYPDLHGKGKLDSEILRIVYTKVSSLAIAKILTVCRNSIDSIIISSILGLVLLAKYQNYYYAINGIGMLFTVIVESLITTVGNTVAVESKEYNYDIFKKISFTFNWLSGGVTVFLFCMLQDFIVLWIGKENLLSSHMAFLFCMYFYLLRMGDIGALYIESAGLWNERRRFVIIETAVNLTLNIVLAIFWGLYGIIIATLLSLILVNIPGNVYVIFKFYFHRNISQFLVKEFKYLVVCIISCLVSACFCVQINIESDLLRLLCRSVISIISGNLTFLLFYYKEEEFRYCITKIGHIFGRFLE